MATHNLPMISVMCGKIAYNQALDMELAEGKPAYDFQRIGLLIDAYLPTVRES
jgi:hypothetical protein